MGVRDVGQLELLAVLGVDDGDPQGVGAAAAVLSSQQVPQSVTGPDPHLHLVVVGLQSLQSYSVINRLRATFSVSVSVSQY